MQLCAPDEYCFWQHGKDIPFTRLPEFFYEFVKEQFGAGKTAEAKIAEIAAAIGHYAQTSVFVRIFLGFLCEQWEHSTLQVSRTETVYCGSKVMAAVWW